MKKIAFILLTVLFATTINAQYVKSNLNAVKYSFGDIRSYTNYGKENLSYITSNEAGPSFSADSLFIVNLFAQIDSLTYLAEQRAENIIVPEEVMDSRAYENNDEMPTDTTDPYAEREYKSDFENKDEDSFGNPMVDQINPLKKQKTKFVIETGINNFIIADNNQDNAEVAPGQSWFWSYGLMKQISKSKSAVIEVGITYMKNRFTFDNNVLLTNNNSDAIPVDFDEINSAKNTKLHVGYIQVPLNFKFNLGKSYYANIGGYGGYRIFTIQKAEYTNGTEEIKEERSDSYGLNNWVYGGRAGVGFKTWDIFFNYNFSNLFKKDDNYKYNIYSIGTSFRI